MAAEESVGLSVVSHSSATMFVMDTTQHDQAAEQRYQQRREARQAQQDDSAKGIIDFHEMARRDTRRRLAADRPVI